MKLAYRYIAIILTIISIVCTILYYNHTKNTDLVCVIKHGGIFKRGDAVYKTWGSKCDLIVFLSKNYTYNLPILTYNRTDEYTKLTDKMLTMLPMVYSLYSNYKWFLVADDDSYVNVKNLKAFLSDKDSQKTYIYGCEFNDYLSGGASYVIPNIGMKLLTESLARNSSYCYNNGIEDMNIIHCLTKKLNFIIGDTKDGDLETFHPYSIQHHLTSKDKTCCSDKWISFHYIKPAQMYTLQQIESNNQFFTQISQLFQ